MQCLHYVFNKEWLCTYRRDACEEAEYRDHEKYKHDLSKQQVLLVVQAFTEHPGRSRLCSAVGTPRMGLWVIRYCAHHALPYVLLWSGKTPLASMWWVRGHSLWSAGVVWLYPHCTPLHSHVGGSSKCNKTNVKNCNVITATFMSIYRPGTVMSQHA